MDLLPIIVVFLVIAVVSGGAKRRQAREAGDGEASPSPALGQSRPTVPVDVDLPGGQATMPTHWSEEGGASREGYAVGSSLSQSPAHYMKSIFDDRPDEEMKALYAEKAEHAAATIPGLNLRLDGDTMVEGVILSEILTRRQPRRPR